LSGDDVLTQKKPNTKRKRTTQIKEILLEAISFVHTTMPSTHPNL